MPKSPWSTRDQWEAMALDYADEKGWDVIITHCGAEFYLDNTEMEHWDYEEEGEEEYVRY